MEKKKAKNMLSNMIIRSQRFVIIIDEVGEENTAKAVMTQFLRDRGERNIRYIDIFGGELKTPQTRDDFLNECKRPLNLGHQQWNIILPTLSDLLIQLRPSVLFDLFQHLKRCNWVKRTLLWIVPHYLIHKDAGYIVTSCKYMSDLILHLKSPNLLTIMGKKPNGTPCYRTYNYKRKNLKYILDVDPVTGVPNGRIGIPDKRTAQATLTVSEAIAKANQLMGINLFDGYASTFKINLNEEEMIARNSLKLPYEKIHEVQNQPNDTEGNDNVEDDMDEEDPDNDLDI